ncbi:MAG TPA: asparagine synthase (glutamine-hydrolyzing) [Usitatibacter sp.]|nr:asparagine synthase (glutamine-hydrolyzing) [Usitatibacter sp.]
MCGIAGIVGPSSSTPERQRQVRRMMDVLAHRGPDGEGFASGRDFCFGHRRLAIIDVPQGAQPMMSDDGKVTLIYNGEIYNYVELQQELAREGVRFKTHSDTEVLLRAYERYGRDVVKKLNGMFAFAIHDARKNLFFAARDHFGVKPFYYVQLEGGQLAFASEIKALFCAPDVPRRLAVPALHEYLTFQFCLGDKTLFEGVKKLLPGTSLACTPGGPIEVKQWWSPSFHVDTHHTGQYFEDRLAYLVHDSVKGQLRSDVPVGAYLSGGLDSSIVVAAAAPEYGTGFQCFSGRFTEGESYDESRYARIVAQEYGCEYHEVVPTARDFIESMGKLMYHMDEPAAGPGLLPQYVVSRHAQKNVKVVLGGQGGDEIFGGYARYLVAYLEQCIKGAIFETQEEGSHIVTLESIIPNMPLLKDYVPMIRKFWGSGLFDSMEERYFRLLDRSERIRGVISGDVAGGFSEEAIRAEFHEIFNASESKSYLNKMTYFDQCTLLPALLQVEDRVSMAVSLESRVPLLDYRIAELAASMPPSIKFAGGRSKNALKEAMKSTLPEAIVARQDKMGFPVPLSEWLRGPAREFVCDTLLGETSRSRGLFEPNALRDLIDNESKYGREIWGALCLELWFRAFLDADATAGASGEAPAALRATPLRAAH